MEGLALVAVVLFLGVIAGAVMGWLAFLRLDSLARRVAQLEQQVRKLTPAVPAPPVTNTDNQPVAPPAPPAPQPKVPAAQPAPPPPRENRLIANIKAHWMVWLGGTCIGFAGIFLAKHSIEQGLLGPTGRIVLTIVAGLLLHGGAEYLRRTTGKASDVFAAMAGGASLMLYAALLAALHLYQLASPGVIFAGLILVSLATMVLALRHGPVLAALGIVGAFSVPLLVDTGSNNVAGALVYSLIITLSALLLIRYVFRAWLWTGTLVGALGWAVLALINGQNVPVILTLYLTAVAYAALAIHRWDALLTQDHPLPANSGILAIFDKPGNAHESRLAVLFSLTLLLQLLSIATRDAGPEWLATLPMLPLLLFWIARHNPVFSVFPWLALLASMAGLLFVGLTEAPDQTLLLGVLAELAGVYVLLSLWLLRTNPYPGLWASLAFLSPVLLLAVGYLCVERLSTHWGWALATALLGALYLHLAFRQQVAARLSSPVLIVSLTLAGHFAFSLALVMLVREATLTLALAVQVISLTWLHRRFSFRALELAGKAVLAIVITRLSLNPELLSYPTDVHWSLWTYGGAVLCCLAASRLASSTNFREWLVGASVHLFVLMLFFEVRYWLHGGQIFENVYSFTEAAINTAIWGALGLVYHWRAQFSEQLRKVYATAAHILLGLALANFGLFVVVGRNPLFTDVPVSPTPVFNILLLAYGVPVALFAAADYLLPQPHKRLAGLLGGASLLLFCTLEVRHLWHRGLSLADPMLDGELYTYSMVWLALAIAGSVWAIRHSLDTLYKGSMALLVVVVAKIFVIDMDGLTGLLRAASFMGLGLSLLGLAYLHQRVKETETKAAQ